MKRRQRGIALITAVLIVALATLAAAAALESTRRALHRAENLRDSETEWWYAIGVESWVKSILARDAQDNQVDSLQDAWAKPVDYLPVDYGSIRGAIIDQQGLFNLNNFGVQKKEDYDLYVAQFERLLQGLGGIEGADMNTARVIAASVRDWIDADDQPTGMDGAEDGEYLGHNPPHRAGNRYLESVSEVLAIKGMTPKLYRQLLPYITALPQVGTKININTAPDLILRTLDPQPKPELLKFIEERIKTPQENLGQAQNLVGAKAPPIDVSSHYFMLRAEVFIGSGRLALYSFFLRPANGAPVVLGRSLDSP